MTTSIWPTRATHATPAAAIEAVRADVNDNQASLAAKLATALGSPHAHEIERESAPAIEFCDVLRGVEQDPGLTPEGRRTALLPEVERLRFNAATLDERAADLEETASDLRLKAFEFTHGESDSDFQFARDMIRQEAATPEGRAAISRRFATASAKGFDQLTRAEGVLMRTVFDAHDLGAPIVDPVLFDAAAKNRADSDANAPDVAGLRSRAQVLRQTAGALRASGRAELQRLGLASLMDEDG